MHSYEAKMEQVNEVKEVKKVEGNKLKEDGWLEFPAIKAKQPGGTVYMISVSGKKLIEKAIILKRGLDSRGIQRICMPAHCKRIAGFYTESNALLPNSIIGSIDSKYFLYEEDKIYLSPKFVAEIIDGQHRLWGFHQDYNESDIDFEIFFAFLIDAETGDKARLFYKINKEAKRINPSLAFDLLSLIDDGGLDQALTELIRKLNEEPTSPFHEMIRMNPNIKKTVESITLVTMMAALKDFITTAVGRSFIKKDNVNIHGDKLYRMVFDYYNAIKELVPDQWIYKDSPLIKSLGIAATFMVLDDVIGENARKHGWDQLPGKEALKSVLDPIKDFDFNEDEVSNLAGKKGQNLLAEMLRETLNFGKFDLN